MKELENLVNEIKKKKTVAVTVAEDRIAKVKDELHNIST